MNDKVNNGDPRFELSEKAFNGNFPYKIKIFRFELTFLGTKQLFKSRTPCIISKYILKIKINTLFNMILKRITYGMNALLGTHKKS